MIILFLCSIAFFILGCQFLLHSFPLFIFFFVLNLFLLFFFSLLPEQPDDPRHLGILPFT